MATRDITNGTIETIGQRIRKLRDGIPLTQQELSEKSGVPVATIKDIERKPRRPHNKTLRNLAQALNVTPTYLLFGQEKCESDMASKV